MITIEIITNWLKEPHHLQEVAPRALLQFAKEYPFFTPAHYLKFNAVKQDESCLFALGQSYPVNLVLLGDFINAAHQLPTILDEEEEVIYTPEHRKQSWQEMENVDTEMEEILFYPASANDYFSQQGIHIPEEIPEVNSSEEEEEKSLMVVMSFAEWLNYIHSKGKKAKEEEEDQRALKTMWQKQKLAAAIEEGSEEIPEQVFEMAVNSISRQDELISESLADVYLKQGKRQKAIDMYRKLSLLNPEKNTYFAAKIEILQKDL